MNGLQTYKALAKGVVLESIRRKDIWVVAILGFLVIISAGALGFFGFSGLEIFAKDLGLTVLGMFSTAVAILTSSRLLPEEIRNRTLYPLLARPITRFDFLVGKWLGATLVCWLAFLILCGTTALALGIFGVPFELILIQYMICKMMGLALLCAVTLMLSAFMTPTAAATLSLILAFGSSMMVRALVIAEAGTPSLAPFLKVLNALLPQYGLFDLSGRAVNVQWTLAPTWVVGALAAYMAVYSLASIVLGWSKFRKQAI